MSDFIAKYELGQEPPGTWESDVGRLAVSAGIEVLVASRAGRQLTLIIRVPGGAGALAGDIAEAFWRDVVPALSGPGAEGPARRVESSERPGRSASAWALRVLPMVIGVTVFLAFFGRLVFEMGLNWSRFSRSGFYASFLSGIIFAASVLLLSARRCCGTTPGCASSTRSPRGTWRNSSATSWRSTTRASPRTRPTRPRCSRSSPNC